MRLPTILFHVKQFHIIVGLSNGMAISDNMKPVVSNEKNVSKHKTVSRETILYD